MAKAASKYFFLFLFNILTISSSATLVGFAFNGRENTSAASSTSEVTSFDSLGLKLDNVPSQRIRVYVADHRVLNFSSLLNSNASSSVDLYLNLSLVVDLMQSELSAISWLETNVLTTHPHVNIKSIILSCSSEEFEGKNVLPLILSALKSFHSALNRIHLDMKVKVSVAFPLPLLENLNTSHEGEIGLIFGYIKKTGSVVIIEAGIDGKLSMAEVLVQPLLKKAIKATSILPDSDILIDLVMKSPLVPDAKQVAEFTEIVSKFFENNSQIDELYADVASSMGEFVQKGLKIVRRLQNSLKTSIHDTTIFPTTPVPPDNKPTPTIVTVPATNPVTVSPANPSGTPLPIPSTTPVNIPPATPVNPAAPVTNPATIPAPVTVPGGAQPVTNPAAAYPPPAGGNVPVPVTPPATTNAPAIPGQSWCVAKNGVSETAIQQALDYACGIGGADCSLIQQGASCYNPNTLQNHASFAFNSYYQKNPSPTSCDFGGTAMIVNTNPSTGSCVFPSSSSSSSSSAPPSPPTSALTPPAQPSSTTPPATTTAPPATTTSPPGTTTSPPVTTSPAPGTSGSVAPPGVLNSSNPASGFGSDSPPVVNTSTSAGSQLILSSLTLVTSFVIGLIIQQI